MNYQRIYDTLIQTRLLRGLDRTKLDGYYEKHHIIPRCLGGLDEDSNYVLLTAKEHILAHLLLHEIYPLNIGLASASFLLMQNDSNKRSLRLSAKLREDYGSLQKIKNEEIRLNSKDGYVLSKETRLKMSESRKGHIMSEETKARISNSEKGKIVSEKTRKLLSDSYVDTKSRRESLSKIAKSRMKDENLRFKISNTLKNKSNLQNTNGIKITDGNLIFNSLKECSNYYNITKRELILELESVNSRFQILNKPSAKRIEGPDGTIYDSLTKCSKITKHSKKTLRNWILNYPEKGYKYI